VLPPPPPTVPFLHYKEREDRLFSSLRAHTHGKKNTHVFSLSFLPGEKKAPLSPCHIGNKQGIAPKLSYPPPFFLRKSVRSFFSPEDDVAGKVPFSLHRHLRRHLVLFFHDKVCRRSVRTDASFFLRSLPLYEGRESNRLFFFCLRRERSLFPFGVPFPEIEVLSGSSFFSRRRRPWRMSSFLSGERLFSRSGLRDDEEVSPHSVVGCFFFRLIFLADSGTSYDAAPGRLS